MCITYANWKKQNLLLINFTFYQQFSISKAAIKTSQVSDQGKAYSYIMVAVAVSCGIVFCIGVVIHLLKKFHVPHLVHRVNIPHEMEVQKGRT